MSIGCAKGSEKGLHSSLRCDQTGPVVGRQSKSSRELEGIREHLREMVAAGRGDEAIDMVVELLCALRDKNTELELRVRKLLKEHFGRRGEGVSSEQLSLLLGELEQDGDEAEGSDDGETEADEESAAPERSTRKKKPRGRKPLPSHLPREREVIKVPEEERPCPSCGGERHCIGHEVSETLEFQPARLFVREHAREKLACRNCDGEVTIAETADKVIDKGLPGFGLLADIIVGKYDDKLPLYRLVTRYRRLGVDIAPSTMSDWVGAAAELLEPLAKLEGDKVLEAFLLQTDDTGLKVLDRQHAANIKRGALWGHIGDGKHVYFFYSPDRKKKWPHEFLEGREGYIQADAAQVYDGLFTRPGSRAIEVGCWMHARRKFVEALDAGDVRAAIPLGWIKKLYKVEARATATGASPEERLALRLSKSKPVLDDLGVWIEQVRSTEPPKEPLGKALTYAHNQWAALGRFLEDGRLPLDNGAPERLNRIIAVGRKNYLFAGSDAGGERAAVIYSLVGGCAVNGIDTWAYFSDVLAKLASGWKLSRLEELLPANWSPPGSTAAAPARAATA